MTTIRIIFIILILTSIGLILFGLSKKSSKTPSLNSSITPKKNNWLGIIGGTIGIIIGICILVFTVSYAWNFASSFFEEKEKPIVQTYTEIHEIPMSGTYLYLHHGWKSKPTSEVEITNPNGEKWTDIPGVNNYPGYQPDGWYYFVAKQKNCQVKTEDTY